MNLKEVLDLVKTYESSYRNPNLGNFEKSPIYDLFPNENTNKEYIEWPKSWFHNGRYGVYLIMNKEFEVIYIGESTNIGKRLSAYFGYDKDKNCLVKHNGWKKEPKYIVTFAVSDDTWFERLSLEDYLIFNASPIDNIKGK